MNSFEAVIALHMHTQFSSKTKSHIKTICTRPRFALGYMHAMSQYARTFAKVYNPFRSAGDVEC